MQNVNAQRALANVLINKLKNKEKNKHEHDGRERWENRGMPCRYKTVFN